LTFPDIISIAGADQGATGLDLRHSDIFRRAAMRCACLPSATHCIEKDIAHEDAVSIRLLTVAHGGASL
jgi:hypothetical protein